MEPAPPLLRQQHQVGVHGGRTGANRRVLFAPGIDTSFIPATQFRLKQPNDAVVFELLPDRPHQDWAHRAPPSASTKYREKTPKSNMKLSNESVCYCPLFRASANLHHHPPAQAWRVLFCQRG